MTKKSQRLGNHPVLVPPGGIRAIIGERIDGKGLVTPFRGSTWSVMDLRTTFCGLPQYQLVEKLKGLHDVVGWKPGFLMKKGGN